MPRKKRKRIQLHEQQQTVMLDMGPIEIWDGADLSLLRDTVNRLVDEEARQSISFEMRYVKHVPSGFFGMLLDCFDHNVEICLIRPNDYVQKMLWFQRFFQQEDEGHYYLHSGPEGAIPLDQPLPWTSEADQKSWDANQDQRVRIPSMHRM